MAIGNHKALGVGVIGATGFIGSSYRQETRETQGTRIVALCARRKDLLEQAAKVDSAVLATSDYREVIEHPEVDLVIVATPDALHHEAVMACATAEKHVLCEKPVGINVGEAFAMWNAYKNKLHLAHFVPYWTRYLTMFSRVKALVGQGLIGEVKSVIYRWLNPRPATMPLTWRDDPRLSAAGSIADVGSHSYDTMRWILGKEAVRVLAHADTITPAKADLGAINLSEALRSSTMEKTDATYRKGGTVDYANVSFEFHGGITATLMVSHAPHLRKGLAPELELHGTEASLAVDRMRGQILLAKPNQLPDVLETHPEDFGNRFSKHVFPAVRAVIAGEVSDHPSLYDGYRVQAFTDSVAQSARLGQWVEIETGGKAK